MKKKVLLVEDEAILAMARKKELDRYEYETSYVTSGEEAVDLVCHQNEPFDLVLMDIDLGRGIDGAEAARQILESREIPIVFLSSHVEPEIVGKTETITSYGYVVKSSNITVLDASIKMAFKLYHSQKQVNEHRTFLARREKELKASQQIARLGTWHLDITTGEVSWTDQMYELYGLDPSLPPPTYEENAALFAPESWELLTSTIEETLKSGEPYELELERAENGASIGWMWTKGEVARDETGKVVELWGVAQDITAEKETERALRESREKYKRLYDHAPFLMVEGDTDTNEITNCNPATAEALASTPEDIIGKKLYDVLPHDRIKTPQKHIRKSIEEKSVQTFENMENGKFFWNVIIPVFVDGRRLVQIVSTDITELRTAQDDLRASTNLLQTITDNTSDMVSLVSKEGTFLYVSSSHERVLGYSTHSLIGRHAAELVHPEDLGNVSDALANVVRGGTPSKGGVRLRYLKSGGEYIWLESMARAQTDDNGDVINVVISSRDITEKTQKQNDLRESKERFRALAENVPYGLVVLDFVSNTVVYATPHYDTLNGWPVGSSVGRTVDELNGYIHEADREITSERISNAISRQQVFVQTEFRLSESVFDEERWIETALKLEYDSNGNPVKAYVIAHDITAEKNARKALQEKTDLLENIFHTSTDLIALTDFEGNFTMVSNAHRILGWEPEELVDKNVLELVHPDDLSSLQEEYRIFLENPDENRSAIYRYRRRDGTYLWFETTGTLLPDENGNTKRFLYTTRDVTERKRRGDQLKRQNELHTAAESLARIGNWSWDVAEDDVYWSDGLFGIFGRHRDEGAPSWAEHPNLYVKDDFERLTLLVNDCIQHGTPYETELRAIRAEGEIRHCVARGMAERDAEGTTIRLWGILQDVTEQRQTETALKKSEERFSLAMEAAGEGIWDIDEINDEFYCSPGLTTMLGYDSPDVITYRDDWYDLIHPDDLQKFHQAYRDCVDGRVDSFAVEYRMKAKNGDWKHILDRGRAVSRDAAGKAARMIGTNQDITERVGAKEEIRRQLREKETLLKEVNHRIKNNMAQVESLLSLQANSTDNSSVRSALHDAMSRVASTRTLYDKLLIGEVYDKVSMQEYLEGLIDSLVGIFDTHSNVTVEKRITDFTLIPKDAIPIGIILNELLTNVFKYAFRGTPEDRVLVKLEKADSQVTLTVEDNGVGVNSGTELSSGFGSTIVSMLAEQFNGSFVMDGENGTKSTVTLFV